jgi:hypothetical protein
MSAMSFSASMEMLAGDIAALCIALVQSLGVLIESVNCEIERYEWNQKFWIEQ